MAELPIHPRLAHMVRQAQASGAEPLACDLAALLSERDPIRADAGAASDADIEIAAAAASRRAECACRPANGGRRRPAPHPRPESDRLRAALGGHAPSTVRESAAPVLPGLLLAFAYPDRVGQLRAPRSGRFLLRNGNGAALAERAVALDAAYIVAAELDGRRPESRIFLAARRSELSWTLSATSRTRSRSSRRLRGTRERVRSSLASGNAWCDRARAERPLREPDPDAVSAVLLDGSSASRPGRAAVTDGARTLRQRLAFLHRVDASWPDVSDAALSKR